MPCGVAPEATEPAAEKAAENVSEAAEIAKAAGAGTARRRVKCRVAILVVFGALVFVGKHVVRLVDLFEFLLRRFVAGVHIRVILFRQCAVCLFDRCVIGVFVNP